MSNKKLILTKKQLDEICGSDMSYLDGLSTGFPGNIFSTEVSSDGSFNNDYPVNTTTDDFEEDQVNDYRGNAIRGLGPVALREMKKGEWKKMFLEEKEHGNKRLKHKRFGASNGDKGKGYDETKMAISRYKQAKDNMINGSSDDIKRRGAKTVMRMKKNWKNIDVAEKQYNAAKAADAIIQNSLPDGEKIKVTGRNSGNGKAHSKKQNGIITYFK